MLVSSLFIIAGPAPASIKRAWVSKYAGYEVVGKSHKEPLAGFPTTAG